MRGGFVFRFLSNPTVKRESCVFILCALTALLATVELFVRLNFIDNATPARLMKISTCLGLLSAAISLGWLTKRKRAQKSEWLGRAFSLAPLAIGGITLFQYAFEINFGAEQRMAPNAAICLLLLGVSLLILDGVRWRNRMAQQLAIGSGCIALFAIFGYLFEAQGLYKISSFIRMLPETALSVFALSIGILLARPKSGFIRIFYDATPSGMFARRMMIAAFCLPPLLDG